ncbi:two-component sensor histidine kinase [Pseudomonas floridensis]|uniref:histidine kinase n=1 Tax=Pseudomonas floridensis TaxID=1958950 RepID=A0A1X0MJW4_9PSED|nr:sensor histidine kinase [Pseudomonas floridensis]ORC47385.1 two-component sensor histidine kinase [Pseudomonas floridensis]
MYAILRLFRFKPDAPNSAPWIMGVLCASAILGNLLLFIRTDTFPVTLLTLNLLTFASVWLYLWRSSRLIQLQPQELAQRMLQVQETERHRLSRELHDDIGQMLTGAQLQLAWLQRRLPAELDAHAGQLDATLAQTLGKVRDLSAILNPRQLSSLGLEGGLRAHLVTALADSQISWSLECQQRLNGIPEEMAVAVYRICQEAVTNMLRHAQANNLLIRIERQPPGLSVFIADDGAGFDPAANGMREDQNGLAGMRERVLLLDGSWSLHSSPGFGTRIDLLFPWAPRSDERARLHKKPQ